MFTFQIAKESVNIFYILSKVFRNLIEAGENGVLQTAVHITLSAGREKMTICSDVGAIMAYDWVSLTKASSDNTFIHLLSEII
jgi:hypothetical protein